MTKDELIRALTSKGMDEILELIQEAEDGELAELELVPSLGLLRDHQLNEAVLAYLRDQGVDIVYINEEDE